MTSTRAGRFAPHARLSTSAGVLVSLLAFGAGCGLEHSTSPPPNPNQTPPPSGSDDDPMTDEDDEDDEGPGAGPMQPGAPRPLGPKTMSAHQAFWTAFRGGQYARIAEVIGLLEGALEEDAENATSAGYIGYLYVWRISESSRMRGPINPVQDISAARRAFERALEIEPSNARFLGFMGSMAMTEGRFTNDPALTRRGEEAMARAVQDDPEFNLFTAGYMQSLAPYDSPAFMAAVDQQWEGLERCLGFALDRTQPSLGDVPPEQVMPSMSRACGESGLAPHNLKGFMLNMGDMVVKSGDWQAAQKLYEIAKASESYETWPYRSILEARIQNAQTNVQVFRTAGFGGDPVNTLMFASRFSCMGCHEVAP